MKKLYIFFSLFALIFVCCSDDNEYKWNTDTKYNGKVFSSSNSYVIIRSNNVFLWQTDNFESANVNIPSENPSWFDIVLTSGNKEFTTSHNYSNKYLFIHSENPQMKSFSFDSIVQISEGIKIVYYEGKTVENGGATYKKYCTNAKGKLIITENNGEYMNGSFVGNIEDVINNNIYELEIKFNKIPITILE